jgi:hypothetical protein
LLLCPFRSIGCLYCDFVIANTVNGHEVIFVYYAMGRVPVLVDVAYRRPIHIDLLAVIEQSHLKSAAPFKSIKRDGNLVFGTARFSLENNLVGCKCGLDCPLQLWPKPIRVDGATVLEQILVRNQPKKRITAILSHHILFGTNDFSQLQFRANRPLRPCEVVNQLHNSPRQQNGLIRVAHLLPVQAGTPVGLNARLERKRVAQISS